MKKALLVLGLLTSFSASAHGWGGYGGYHGYYGGYHGGYHSGGNWVAPALIGGIIILARLRMPAQPKSPINSNMMMKWPIMRSFVFINWRDGLMSARFV